MSLMAGFDFVTEISNETIRKLILNQLQIGGVAAKPPFELSLPISGGGATGNAHMIVNDLQVDLNANDTITLTLAFDRASLVTTAPLPLTVCPLAGNLTITAALQLVSADGSNKQVAVNMGEATVDVVWSAAANQAIAQDLAGAPITPAMFTTFARQALTAYVHSVPAPTVPLTFNVVPGSNGSISPSLRFEKLELHCIPNAARNRQALGLFGILLAANHANGNHNQKTATAIAAAHDGVAVSISPGAFHSLIFCPAIATALGTGVANLPGSCGASGGLDIQGVTVNSISDSFANGQINLHGSVSKSGFCYDASGTFDGRITFTASGSTLTPVLTMGSPDVDVDIPWYCYLAAGVVLGPLGLVLAGIVDSVADDVATSLAGDALAGALGGGIPGASLGGLAGATFTSVPITTEGLTLQGTVPLYVSHPFVMPQLNLTGSVITTQSQSLGSGVFHTQLWCMPEAKDYPYTEYSQQQRGSYNLSGTLVCVPFAPEFSIRVNGQSYALDGASGTLVIPNVETHYPMPLATGGTSLQQTVHIAYVISGTGIQLSNVPAEGNYSVSLHASARDCNGQPLQDDEHDNLAAYIHVQFEGDHADIGGGYAADVQHCAQQLSEMIKRITSKYRPYQKVPIWQQVNYPAPDDMIRYIRDIMALELPQADDMLITSKLAHGNSFYRALLSPAAKQPGLLKGKVNAGLAKQQLANVALTAVNLQQLSETLQVNAGINQAQAIAVKKGKPV